MDVEEEKEGVGSMSLVRTAVTSLRELWGNQKLSDITVTLELGSMDPPCRKYELHRAVLFSSGYFRSILEGEWGESRHLRPDDPLFTADAFEKVVRGLYGFDIDLGKDNVLNVLAVGSYLQVEEVCEGCKAFLHEQLDRMSLGDVAQCFATVACREYPGSEEIKQKSLGLLAVHASDEARDELLRLPPVVLAELLASNELWVTDEPARVDLILDLLERTRDIQLQDDEPPSSARREGVEFNSEESGPSVDPELPEFRDPVHFSGCLSSSSPFGGSEAGSSQDSWTLVAREAARNNLADALIGVLKSGVHYMFIPDDQLFRIQNKLRLLRDAALLEVFKEHYWARGVFYGALSAMQPSCELDDQTKLLATQETEACANGWFRFGVEFTDVEQMVAKQQQDSAKVYYAGLLWWVKLRFKERDETEDTYNAYVCVTTCKPTHGCFVEERGRGAVDVDAMVKDKFLNLRDFKFNTTRFGWGDGRGWAVFKKANLELLQTRAGTIRMAVALRVVM